VAIRVDASAAIGTGHFLRCLTLADALQERGSRVRFACRHVPQHLRDLALRRGHEIAVLNSRPKESPVELPHSEWLGCPQGADAQDSIQALGGNAWDWLVVDHYGLDARWELALRAVAGRVLAIDDLADRVHDCDVLLDQNLYADMRARYAGKAPAHCQLLLGPRHALLRQEFRRLHDVAVPREGVVQRVLVSFGGVDSANFTATAIEAVATMKGLQIDVVIGAQHPDRGRIESACAAMDFACHVQTERIAELMASADLAIGGGGSSTWERCSVGLPALTYAIAANQRQLVEDAALEGLLYAPTRGSRDAASMSMHLRALVDNPALLRGMSVRGLKMVDGRGTDRVLRAMGVRVVDVRQATPMDSGKIFDWRNDPAVRSVSRDSQSVERSAHEKWFTDVLANPDQVLLIGRHGGDDIGVVRFDVDNGAAEASIYLAPERHQKGSGADLLLAAESWLNENRDDVRTIEATVLRDNERSRGLFEACGYRITATNHEKRLSK
jgi:UDP-2,4-diacetamido-2,4,6-trideoxy-beta-L-altropyranose hydrolase